MNSKIGVFVRSRPLLNQEARGKRCISISNDTISIADKKYNFDSVFDENASQLAIYDRCVRSLVDGCFEGFNGTVFAYGQTGSGKTHSIMGTSQEEEGIIPRAIRQVFHILSKEQSNRIANVRVSMMEIYNDECKDLLHIDIPSRDIMIREDKDGRIFFTGAREEVVSDFQSAMYFLNHGNINRTTAETLMNQSSSRSHAIFTISIELLEYGGSGTEGQGSGSYIQAKLHLVDLAGSERAKRTGAQGSRLKESVGINQGLLSLGKVIRALTSNPITHVPYRESKLTRFLQDSLGGNSQTVMLACISSAECNVHETLSTLQYASRAKIIQNKVVANVAEGVALIDSELETSMVAALKQQILQMQSQIERINGHQMTGGVGMGGLSSIPEHSSTDSRQDGATNGNNNNASNASVNRILRIVNQIQESLQVTLRGIDASGATAASCGAAWQLVVVAREAVRIMQSVAAQQSSITTAASTVPGNTNSTVSNVRLSMSLKNLRQSFSQEGSSGGLLGAEDKLANSVLESEVEALRQELEECRDDLKRDEDIFAEKIRELKKAKKTIKELEDKNKKLLEKQAELPEQLLKGKGTPFTYIPLNADEKKQLSLATTSAWEAKDAKAADDDEFDDLDISIAVAATEPDISQLMEDLEAMAKEKEELAVDSKLAEEKVESMSQSVKNQKMEFVKGQVQLKHQLKQLESQISDKELTIAQLVESNTQTKDMASKQALRAQKLEKEQEELTEQLRVLDSMRNRNIEEFEEERQLRHTFERKLQHAQEQLQLMEQQQKNERNLQLQRISEEEQRKADTHVQELESFKHEHAKLQKQIQLAELAQKKKLAVLNDQVDQYKQKSSESADQIAELERRNAELMNKLEHISRTKLKSMATRSQVPSTQPTNNVMNPDLMKNWLTKRINNINDAKISATELARLQDIITSLQTDKTELLKELEPLEKKKHDFEEKLSRKIDSITQKIKTLKVTYFQHKQELEGLKHLSPQRITEQQQERIDDLEKEMGDIEYSIGSYDEHREECVERLNQGALEGDVLLRYSELKEELETIETEIELNNTNIAQERKHLNKVQQATQTTKPQYNDDTNRANVLLLVPSDGKDIGSVDEYANMLLNELKSNYTFSGLFEDDGHSSQFDNILLQMLHAIITEKYRVTSLDAASKHSKQQLDDKCAEYDELVKTMQKTRNDFIRRQEQQRKENEDKISFLLQQLRSVEARIAHNNEQHNNNNVTSSMRSGNQSRPSTADNKLLLPSTSLEDSISSVISASETTKKLTDSLILERSKGSESKDLQEIARRWQNERKKRHRLEQRNQDMSKELALLRSAVSGLTSSSSHLYGSTDTSLTRQQQEYEVEMSSSKYTKK